MAFTAEIVYCGNETPTVLLLLLCRRCFYYLFFFSRFFIVGMLACKFNFIVLRMNALVAREAMGHNKHCMYFVLT